MSKGKVIFKGVRFCVTVAATIGAGFATKFIKNGALVEANKTLDKIEKYIWKE